MRKNKQRLSNVFLLESLQGESKVALNCMTSKGKNNRFHKDDFQKNVFKLTKGKSDELCVGCGQKDLIHWCEKLA